jgi:hypothetical protein
MALIEADAHVVETEAAWENMAPVLADRLLGHTSTEFHGITI